jgi:hypothetical protein
VLREVGQGAALARDGEDRHLAVLHDDERRRLDADAGAAATAAAAAARPHPRALLLRRGDVGAAAAAAEPDHHARDRHQRDVADRHRVTYDVLRPRHVADLRRDRAQKFVRFHDGPFPSRSRDGPRPSATART